MLHIVVPERELFDDETQAFITMPAQEFDMEHSLLSLSKWESKHHKPFLNEKNLTPEELIDYFKCMTITKNVDDAVYQTLPDGIIKQIDDYIHDPMTATWFNDANTPPSRQILTSEVIYFWMVDIGIPFECQKWHLNRLITLIRVYSANKGPKKKMSTAEIMDRNRRLNEERKAQAKTAG